MTIVLWAVAVLALLSALSTRRKLAALQETLDGIKLFVVPSSSARTAAYQRDAKLAFHEELKRVVDRAVAEGGS